MRRKKKPKFYARNEFRYNYSPSAAGHPDYVFGKVGNRYKSFGLTSHPRKSDKVSPLTSNPNIAERQSNPARKSYIHKSVRSTQKRYMSPPLKGWAFDSSDIPLIRHKKKQYRKNRRK